jgi:hypothetical protein
MTGDATSTDMVPPTWVPVEPAIQHCINYLKDAFETIARVCSLLDATIVLDEKLVPLEGEDESRIVKLLERSKDPKTGLIDPQSIPPRMWRSYERRWLRAWNYSVKNFVRAMTGKRIDGCPRLTRARRLVARSTPRARKAASAQKRARYRDPSVKRREKIRLKRLRADNPVKVKALLRSYRQVNPDKVKAQRRLQHDINYHRPFISFDFEGMNHPGNDIVHNDVCYPDHGLFLGGASGVHRDENGAWCEKPIEGLGHNDKRNLRGEEILQWLLSLPDKYGNATFAMFGMSYDATQILKALGDFLSNKRHFEKVYAICKREKHGTKRSVKASVCVGDYSIDYLKGRRLVIKKIKRGEDGVIRTVKKITIYDLFGFYQSKFVEVVESLVPLGLANPDEVERIRSDKARRAEFHQVPLEEIKIYTTLNCACCRSRRRSRAMVSTEWGSGLIPGWGLARRQARY